MRQNLRRDQDFNPESKTTAAAPKTALVIGTQISKSFIGPRQLWVGSSFTTATNIHRSLLHQHNSTALYPKAFQHKLWFRELILEFGLNIFHHLLWVYNQLFPFIFLITICHPAWAHFSSRIPIYSPRGILPQALHLLMNAKLDRTMIKIQVHYFSEIAIIKSIASFFLSRI